jgi:cysteine synthase
MVETFSVERRQIMRAYGAKVVLTPAAERGSGMVRKAAELAEQHGWFYAKCSIMRIVVIEALSCRRERLGRCFA